MPKVTHAIQLFLNARKAQHNGPDLLERWTPFMETQVNVSAGKGWKIEGKSNSYTDGIDEWWNIRIPKKANSTPEFKDYNLSYPLELHAEAIGSTGWDWSARRSRWLGYDFDSIVGHAAGVGISEEELDRVKQVAQSLPFVEVRRSTGGKGLHLYVYFDDEGVPTSNHTEHAALGRAVLGMMASEAGFDFASHIDACGQNMWIWHRKMTAENAGLTRLKVAERALSLADLPSNWRDHVEVINRSRAKIRISGITDTDYDPFEALANSRRRVPLEPSHKAVIDELSRSGFSSVWVPDHHLLQTHTAALQKMLDDPESRARLKLIGFFSTISKGNDPGTPNCFLFPLDDGAWKVYRFSSGIAESDTWEQDGEGWTTCYFNRIPNLSVAAKAVGGIEDPEHGGYLFERAEKAAQAAESLGRPVSLPPKLLDREAKLKAHKDGRLIFSVLKRDGDEGMEGWVAKKDRWLRVFNTRVEQKSTEVNFNEYDNVIRALVTPNGDDAGWAHRSLDSQWHFHSTEKIKLKLLALGNTEPEAKLILGGAINRAWTLVNLPFQPEYPGGRQWNLNAPQWKYQPAELDDQEPCHPHWDLVLRHCLKDLDDELPKLDWAQKSNIVTGRDYGQTWIAILLREPLKRLPYLYLFGEFNTGKSILHEAITELVTKGVASADRALTAGGSEYNGELANAILAYIEEKDVKLNKTAYNKLKDWVTSPIFWVRKMRTDAYAQINTLHFIHLANNRDNVHVDFGDNRITMAMVYPLEPGQEIPKEVLLQRLRDEAPHFMRTLVDLQLPPMYGRLALPSVDTYSKQRAIELNRSPLEMFITENCFEVPGSTVAFSQFFEQFQTGLDAEDRAFWGSKRKVIESLPQKFPYGEWHSNTRAIGNLSWENVTPDPNARPIVVQGGKLKRQRD